MLLLCISVAPDYAKYGHQFAVRRCRLKSYDEAHGVTPSLSPDYAQTHLYTSMCAQVHIGCNCTHSRVINHASVIAG